MTKLSVNINKFATLRNSRGGNNPDLLQVAKDIEHLGAHGITVHPRPDERHIRYQDVIALKAMLTTEFNIEGNPQEKTFVDLVLAVKPTQVTLVPDARNQLTSNHGWDVVQHSAFLREIIATFQKEKIRVSIFVDPVMTMIEAAAKTGTDRIELYTESYAENYSKNSKEAIRPYLSAAQMAQTLGLEINAGHDLNLHNLRYFIQTIPWVCEVSIGHALICDCLYLGMKETMRRYLEALS